MKRGELIDFDLEVTPIEIKTDSKIGSNEKEEVAFHNAADAQVGGFYIQFAAKVQYFIGYCGADWVDFPSTLPSTDEKVWRITLKRTSTNVQIVIHCNDVEVLDVKADGTACRNDYWNTHWSKGPVKKIKFPSSGSVAADGYRTFTGECIHYRRKIFRLG